MSMVRALRTLTALENGDLTGTQYETILTGSPARVGELRVLLGISSQYKRIASSPVTCTAFGSSATALNQLLSLATPAAYILADSTAVSNLVSSSQGAAKILAYYSGLDYTNYTTMDQAIVSLDLNTAINNTPAATTVFNLSTVAVGKKIAKDSGLTTANYVDVQALAADASAMSTVVGSSTGRTTMLNSNLAMNKMLDSAIAVSAIDGNSATLTSLRSLEMPSVKYIAKKTGTIDYYDYTTAAQMVASQDFAVAIIANTASITAASAITNSTVLNAMAGSTNFMGYAVTSTEFMTGLGAQTTAANTIKASATAMSLLLVQGAGLRGFTSTQNGATAFYSSDYFVPQTSRNNTLIFGFYTPVSGAYTHTTFSGVGTSSTGYGTTTTTSNGLAAIRGSTNANYYMGGIGSISTNNYSITAVLTCHTSAASIPLLTTTSTTYGLVLDTANNRLYNNYAGNSFVSGSFSPALPTNGTTWIVLQIRVVGSTTYARVNNGSEVSISGNSYSLAAIQYIAYNAVNNISLAELIVTTDSSDTTVLNTMRTALGKKYGLF